MIIVSIKAGVLISGVDGDMYTFLRLKCLDKRDVLISGVSLILLWRGSTVFGDLPWYVPTFRHVPIH